MSEQNKKLNKIVDINPQGGKAILAHAIKWHNKGKITGGINKIGEAKEKQTDKLLGKIVAPFQDRKQVKKLIQRDALRG